MTIYKKILITTLPLVFLFFFATIGTTYYFSRGALTELAETWLETRAAEAMQIAAEQERNLRKYGLEDISASITKAKLDAAAMMARIDVGDQGFIFAIDAGGTIAVHPDASQIGRDVSTKKWFRNLKQGKGRLVYTASDDRNFAIYDYFEPWQWFVLATDPERELYGVANRMRPYLIYLGVLVAVVMSTALMLLTRRCTEPLRSLTASADQFGKGDLDTRMVVRSKDEFGQLAVVFNLMAAKLQKTLTTLKHKEEHFRSLIENSSDLVTILDAKGIIKYVSPSCRRILGCAPEQLIGENTFAFLHPDDFRHIQEQFQKRIRSLAEAKYTEFRIRHNDGSWRTLEGIGKNLLEHPAVEGFVVNARDISIRKQVEEALQNSYQELEKRVKERTAELIQANMKLQKEIKERKNAVEALAKSEQRMKAILRASPVGIGLVVDRKLDWANETLHHMLGYENGMLLGREMDHLYADCRAFERTQKKIRARISQSEIGEVETQWIRKDGTIFDCSIRAYSLNEDAPSNGQIIAVADISEAKHLEEMLQRARKMEAIGTLAGGVAHDLNNILSGIVSYPELLLMKLPKESPLRRPIQTIQKSGERAAIIVQDLLTMARRGVAATEVLNLNDIIREQLNTPECTKLRSLYPNVRIETDLEKDLLLVKGSAAHLSKSIMNLLSNAAEAMPEGGTIRVHTRNIYIDSPIRGYEHVQEGDYVAVSVQDTGVGIPDDDLERIFEPFYTKKQMGRSGTGLGMAVVWGTVKDHNGYINIRSAKGEGTILSFYIPITREKISEQMARLPRDQYSGSGETILVVDDADVQREIAHDILEELNYRVVLAPSGEAAVEYLKGNRADLLVLDMIMAPGMDGLDTYRQVLNIRPGQKAIIASGYSETDRVKEAKRLGARQYLKKPYTIEKIGMAVKTALHQ
jgi:PAS domain S-box-containing protein